MGKKALMFAGQGSQSVGMAKDLYENFADARSLADKANDLLGFSITDLMFEGPVETLTETRNTQPALFLHEAMVLAVTGVAEQADGAAGHSLGEFSAYYAAGSISFEDGLKLVRLRGELMFNAGTDIPGTMVAVIGLSNEEVESICQELSSEPDKIVVPANFNAPGQVVISGSRDHVRAIMATFKERGAKLVKELNVSGAFHSPLLNSASQPFSEALDAVSFKDATIPVYVNVSAEPVQEASELKAAAKQQLTAPVRWTQIMEKMQADGFDDYVEVGPGKVLQGLAKRVVQGELTGLATVADCSAINQGGE